MTSVMTAEVERPTFHRVEFLTSHLHRTFYLGQKPQMQTLCMAYAEVTNTRLYKDERIMKSGFARENDQGQCPCLQENGNRYKASDVCEDKNPRCLPLISFFGFRSHIDLSLDHESPSFILN